MDGLTNDFRTLSETTDPFVVDQLTQDPPWTLQMPLTSGKSCTLISWLFCRTFSTSGQRFFSCNFRVVSVKISMVHVFFRSVIFYSKIGDHRWVWENLKFSDGLLLDGWRMWLAAGSAWSWSVWGAQESCHGHCKGRVNVRDWAVAMVKGLLVMLMI